MKMINVSESALESIKRMAERDAKDAERYRALRHHVGGWDKQAYDDYSDRLVKLPKAMQTK